MNRPKILLYLHHVDLGQRYPISDQEVVIGRSLGHVLFPNDERLSAQHCRIFLGSDGKMNLQDLGSANGTVVDGRLLSPQKAYPIREGTLIAVGGQVFKCVEPSNVRQMHPRNKKKRRRREDTGADLTPVFFVIFLALVGYVGFKYKHIILPQLTALNPPPAIISPFEMVYKEVQEAFDEYRETGRSFQEGKLNNKQLAAELRKNLIPKFTAAQVKISVLKPSSELERRRIEANKKLVDGLLHQVTVMAKYMETNDQKFSDEMDKHRPALEAAVDEARKLNDMRTPANEY